MLSTKIRSDFDDTFMHNTHQAQVLFETEGKVDGTTSY